MKKFVVFIDRNAERLYVKTLMIPVADCKYTEDKSKAQIFHDEEYIHEKMRDTFLADYGIEEPEKSIMDGIIGSFAFGGE